MNIKAHLQCPRTIPTEKFRAHQGKWIAVSADGTYIVADADNLLELDKHVCAAGEDPETLGYERVDFDESSIGGAELL